MSGSPEKCAQLNAEGILSDIAISCDERPTTLSDSLLKKDNDNDERDPESNQRVPDLDQTGETHDDKATENNIETYIPISDQCTELEKVMRRDSSNVDYPFDVHCSTSRKLLHTAIGAIQKKGHAEDVTEAAVPDSHCSSSNHTVPSMPALATAMRAKGASSWARGPAAASYSRHNLYPEKYRSNQVRAWFYNSSYFKVCAVDYREILLDTHVLGKTYATMHFDNLAKDNNKELTQEEYLKYMEREVFSNIRGKFLRKYNEDAMYFSKSKKYKDIRKRAERFSAAKLTRLWWRSIRAQMEILVSLTLESVKHYAADHCFKDEPGAGVSSQASEGIESSDKHQIFAHTGKDSDVGEEGLSETSPSAMRRDRKKRRKRTSGKKMKQKTTADTVWNPSVIEISANVDGESREDPCDSRSCSKKSPAATQQIDEPLRKENNVSDDDLLYIEARSLSKDEGSPTLVVEKVAVLRKDYEALFDKDDPFEGDGVDTDDHDNSSSKISSKLSSSFSKGTSTSRKVAEGSESVSAERAKKKQPPLNGEGSYELFGYDFLIDYRGKVPYSVFSQ